jgi:periplasmic protein TonB
MRPVRRLVATAHRGPAALTNPREGRLSLLFPSSHPAALRTTRFWSGAGTAVTIHALLAAIAMVGLADSAPSPAPEMPMLSVRLLSEQTSQLQAPAPRPAKPVAPPHSPPLLASAAPTKTPSAFTVAAAPAEQAVSETPAPASPAKAAPDAPLVEARFDADYLSNPKPPYPNASRRLGEAGTVYLRVQVSADGNAMQVDVKTSSGFPRLDQAAVDTVSRWHFIPARRGHAQVVSWVVVPVVFSFS